MRSAKISRNTTETHIKLQLSIDGTGSYDIKSGAGFLDHMLELFCRHGGFDLTLRCEGDTYVDSHHTTEDIGIVLGEAFREALGDKRGIARYGSFLLPMDEALILTALDISGRAHFSCDLQIPAEKVGDFDTELVRDFLAAFAGSMGLTLHVKQLAGTNSHHIIEGVFKGLGRALAVGVALDPREEGRIPSTKGLL
ncbi:MAG: imidazoleglycerol-phosphate dehydratase HisB [Oscillospiraceae bacterium]|nr:imidazoleglycerol-phosphate dehydratase HisB [Oscillospiraceae bacterium]